MKPLAVIVTGGRNFTDRDTVRANLDLLRRTRGLAVVIEGECPTQANPDVFSREWAESTPDVTCERYPADWTKLGRRAGPVRNSAMLERLLAYRDQGYRVGVVSYPGGNGTADMTGKARRAGVPVWEPCAACRTTRTTGG